MDDRHDAPAETPDPLDDLLAEASRIHGYPALAGAVASRDRVLAAGAAGRRRADRDDPVALADRFHLGSITKPMTATLLATLVEEGRLAWDAAPADLLPEFAAVLHPALRPVRLEHLLAHRGGVPPFTDDAELEPVPPFAGSPRERRLSFAGWLLAQPPTSTPLADFAYSNAGYALAAAMAERAADRPWEDLMRERLFAPLGLDSAGFGWPALAHLDQPWGHLKRGPVLDPQPPDGPYQLGPFSASSGDVHASIADLLTFGQMHLRGLAGAPTLLRPETVRELHTSRGRDPAADADYGLGWGIAETASSHAGCAGTFLALLVLRPQRDRVYAIATNAAASQTIDGDPADSALLIGALSALTDRFEREAA